MPVGILTFIILSVPGMWAVIMVDTTPSSIHQDTLGMIPGLTGSYVIRGLSTTLIRVIIPIRVTTMHPTMIMQIVNLIKRGNGTAGSQNAIAVLQLVAAPGHQETLAIQEIQK